VLGPLGGLFSAAHHLDVGELAPQLSPHRAQRLARAPHQAKGLAGRDLAATDRGEHLADCRCHLRRRMQAGEVDAEKLAGVGLAGWRRQDEPQHRQPQIALAPDQRRQAARPCLPQQQPERAAPRVADAGRPALRVAGMPLGEAALRVPGRGADGAPRVRTRARRNRIRTKCLKLLDSALRKQGGAGGLQVGGDFGHAKAVPSGMADVAILF
jgi:hypothetical protein